MLQLTPPASNVRQITCSSGLILNKVEPDLRNLQNCSQILVYKKFLLQIVFNRKYLYRQPFPKASARKQQIEAGDPEEG